MSPRDFLVWLDGFALTVTAGRPTPAQWVDVFATLATVQRDTDRPSDLQIAFIPGGAVRTDEYPLRTDA